MKKMNLLRSITIGGLENVKNMVRLYLEDLRYTKGVLSVVITNIMQDLSLTMLYHSPKEKISFQLGNGKLLSQLTKKKIVFDFRKRDIINGGEGAP